MVKKIIVLVMMSIGFSGVLQAKHVGILTGATISTGNSENNGKKSNFSGIGSSIFFGGDFLNNWQWDFRFDILTHQPDSKGNLTHNPSINLPVVKMEVNADFDTKLNFSYKPSLNIRYFLFSERRFLYVVGGLGTHIFQTIDISGKVSGEVSADVASITKPKNLKADNVQSEYKAKKTFNSAMFYSLGVGVEVPLFVNSVVLDLQARHLGLFKVNTPLPKNSQEVSLLLKFYLR